MQLESKGLLSDMLQEAEAIAHSTKGMTFEDFEENEEIRRAVKYSFIIIAEALNTLSKTDPDTASHISDLPKIVAFRNRLVHGYRSVENGIVWGIVESGVPSLVADVRQLLAEPDDPL